MTLFSTESIAAVLGEWRSGGGGGRRRRVRRAQADVSWLFTELPARLFEKSGMAVLATEGPSQILEDLALDHAPSLETDENSNDDDDDDEDDGGHDDSQGRTPASSKNGRWTVTVAGADGNSGPGTMT